MTLSPPLFAAARKRPLDTELNALGVTGGQSVKPSDATILFYENNALDTCAFVRIAFEPCHVDDRLEI